jgi:hypothetical protein
MTMTHSMALLDFAWDGDEDSMRALYTCKNLHHGVPGVKGSD